MKPFLVIIAVLVVLALLAWVLMRSAARKREEQRAEAARIRAGAQEQQAQLRGQEEYVRQFHEREAVARAEADQARAAADEQARIAQEHAARAEQREEEASAIASERLAHEEVVAQQRSDYEAELSRADEIDPDVSTKGRHAHEAAADHDPAEGEGHRDAGDIAQEAAAIGSAGAVAGGAAGALAAQHAHDEIPAEESPAQGSPADAETPAVESPADEETHEDTWDEDPVGEPGEVTTTEAEPSEADATDAAGATGAADEGAPSAPADAEEPAPWGRRIAGVGEIRDGGYGVGSAAPFPDGAMPQDHPVQAYHDTMTYRTEDSPGYDSAEPDVWFYDAGAAERAGFQRSQED